METWAEPPRTRLALLGQAGHGLIRGFVEAFYFCSGVHGVTNSVARWELDKVALYQWAFLDRANESYIVLPSDVVGY